MLIYLNTAQTLDSHSQFLWMSQQVDLHKGGKLFAYSPEFSYVLPKECFWYLHGHGLHATV